MKTKLKSIGSVFAGVVFLLLVTSVVHQRSTRAANASTGLAVTARWDDGTPVVGRVQLYEISSSGSKLLDNRPFDATGTSTYAWFLGAPMYRVEILNSNGSPLYDFPFVTSIPSMAPGVNPATISSAKANLVFCKKCSPQVIAPGVNQEVVVNFKF